jgi:GNAT superfamily N-acetyltransferase
MRHVEFRRFASVDDFLAIAGPYLTAREAEHNLILGVASSLEPSSVAPDRNSPSFAVVLGGGGDVLAALLRKPPYNPVLSEVVDVAAVDVLVDALRDEPYPGVIGPKRAAARFAAQWRRRTGATERLVMEERIFALDRVAPPPRPAAGTWRTARPDDRDLVARWVVAFVADAGVPDQLPDDPLATADRWIAGIGRQLYLWEDGGRPVSIVGAGGETPNGIRIGPVYTPPELRGHGYATSLTAAASQDQLDRGRRFCFLFTDLANPTSNRIYQQIGYRPVSDVDMYRFDTATIKQ